MSPGSGTEGQASVAGGETGGLETGGPGSFTNCGTIDFGDFQGPQAKARSGDMYNTRVRCKRSSGKGSSDRRSIAHKNAERVLPDPVGARISVWSPAAIAGQPWSCAGAGSAKVPSNQSRTGSEKRRSGSTIPAR